MMRVFVLVSCLIVGALARPEAGYTYNGLLQNSASLHQQLPSEHAFANFAAPPPTTYGTPLSSEPALNNIEQPAEATGPEDVNQQQYQAPQPLPLEQQDSYNAAYQESSIPQEGGYAYPPQPTTIHKHVYVHVPPKNFEDEDVIETRVRHAPAAKQKHYKIVFIKAPAPPSIRPPVVPPPPQNEEKTLIYVLHKKPEATQDIVIPTAAPTKPSKPEVYFIKYKTKKEEAPVYGPPPQQQLQQPNDNSRDNGDNNIIGADMDPRHADVPAGEYGAPATDDFSADLTAPLTTITPALETEQPQSLDQQPQFLNDLPADALDLPTALPFSAGDQPPPTVQAPSNQYLAPEPMAPIVVEEPTHLPSSKYGPPNNRFFLKKK